ncbi:arginase [Salinicoccus sp. ID82-1]|uniref:Arginase n=1 Tax=Salinicoccus cyprini TaxID=2493691 RepID=A0A558AQX8_9STAP|nr:MULTISPECIES: arginase [Salinicoccus]MCG1010302.1 arginase [Salinicoccus sp. ID82-1]TVT26646.1 arginase [Salinicoccus cyprini]
MNQNVHIIGAATAFGQPRLGVDLGPDAIRYAGIVQRLKELGISVVDKGNIRGDFDIEAGQEIEVRDDNLLNYDAVKRFNTALAGLVDDTVGNGAFPLILGGDHSLAIGSLAGMKNHYDNLGVIWYDAHGDLNDSRTSPTGNIHGMPLGISCGFGDQALIDLYEEGQKVKPENVVLIGMRDLDEGEKAYIKENGILTFTMMDIRVKGIRTVMQETMTYLSDRCDGIHLSLDVDGLDPSETPGTGTPVVGGLSLSETQLAMQMLNESDRITSMDLVEVNPLLDDKNMTAEKAVEIAAYLFGKKQL